MIAETSLLVSKWKFAATIAAIGGIWIADETLTRPQSIEDWGLKGLLMLTVGFLVRLLLKQQDEHKTERAKDAETHLADAKAREDKMVTAMTKQSETLDEVAKNSKEQLDYFKTVTRTIVDERLSRKPNLP